MTPHELWGISNYTAHRKQTIMKQIIQSYKTGEIDLVELPVPSLRKGTILVETRASLVSVGTEKHMLEMAKKGLIGKALARPDLVRRVIDKAKTDGIRHARRQAEGRLDTPVALGYSASGIVKAVGEDVNGFFVGDRVAITGPGSGWHAEYNLTPNLFAVKIPSKFHDGGNQRAIGFDEAAFAALGGIALEAVRLVHAQLGDRVAVIGLGLIGQIAAQLLASSGCHVFGMDISWEKVSLAMEHGMEYGFSSADELMPAVREQTANAGVDAVIILAAAKSREPLELAAEISRERGTIVASGLVNLDVPRKMFYEKELGLVVSRAWGPGLYDPNYAQKNQDYPIAYARWTANRNVAEFLSQLSKGRVSVKHLISHRFLLPEALNAYDLILENKEPFLGIVLEYPEKESDKEPATKVILESVDPVPEPVEKSIGIGLMGAGLFTTSTLLPVIKELKNKEFANLIDLKGVATTTGVKASHVGKNFGFSYLTSDYRELLNNPEINLVLILTRHGNHSQLACEALAAGKHIYMEKPLAVTPEQLINVVKGYHDAANNYNLQFMMGFNRRYSPSAKWLKEKFDGIREPLSVHYTVNAGYVPPDSWVHDPVQGGGRIIGEVCHFVDFVQFICNCEVAEVFATSLDSEGYKKSDNVNISLKMTDGSIVSVLYSASGDRGYLRERVEIFGGGAVGVIDNFKSALFVRKGKRQRHKLWGTDWGYRNEMASLFSDLKEGHPMVPFQNYVATTLATFAIRESLRKNRPVSLAQMTSKLNQTDKTREVVHESN